MREMTKIAEHEIHVVVLACTRARKQMMAGMPTMRPTRALARWRATPRLGPISDRQVRKSE